MELLRFILTAFFLVSGVVIIMIATFGVFKLRYVTNRMHAAALGDTFGLLLCMIGVAVRYGVSFNTLKIFLIIVFLWIASPISSHLIAKSVVETDPSFSQECEIKE